MQFKVLRPFPFLKVNDVITLREDTSFYYIDTRMRYHIANAIIEDNPEFFQKLDREEVIEKAVKDMSFKQKLKLCWQLLFKSN